jgi:hypothetical protein
MLTAARALPRRSNVDIAPWIELICQRPRSIEPSVLRLLALGLPLLSAIAIAAAMFAALELPPARVHRLLIWPIPSPVRPCPSPVNATCTWS